MDFFGSLLEAREASYGRLLPKRFLEMENPGEYLKRERELRGVPLSEVARRLRFTVRTLELLEKDDYGKLPHPTYIKGFIRSYCRVLGLDENDAVLRFEAYIKEEAKKDKDAHPRGEAPPALPWFRSNTVTVVSLVSAGIVIVVLYLIFSRGSTGEKIEAPAPQPSRSPASGSSTEPAEGTAAPASGNVSANLPGKTPENKLVVELYAKTATWIMAEVDGKKPFEVLLREGESIKLEASEVFF